jgi:hypothetical protein
MFSFPIDSPFMTRSTQTFITNNDVDRTSEIDCALRLTNVPLSNNYLSCCHPFYPFYEIRFALKSPTFSDTSSIS